MGYTLFGKRKCDGFVVGLISVSVAPERKQNNEWSCEVVVGALEIPLRRRRRRRQLRKYRGVSAPRWLGSETVTGGLTLLSFFFFFSLNEVQQKWCSYVYIFVL